MIKNAKEGLLDSLIVLLPLIFGGAIYICFRPLNLLMFDWALDFGLQDTIAVFRKLTEPYRNLFSGFILFSLPTMFWTFSFTYAVSAIWRTEDDKKAGNFWLCMVLLLSIFGELAQSINLIQGTFDWLDLLANATGFLLAVYSNIFRRLLYA